MRETFTYFECAECGCLQLESPPSDLSKYYPADRYYSLQSDSPAAPPGNPLRAWLKRRRDAAILFQRGGFFGWLASRHPNPGIADVQRWLAPSCVSSFDDPILDVGCGEGALLRRLAGLGFRNLTGIDPYIAQDIRQPGLTIVSGELDSVQHQTFDLVMFHHVFEHLAAPLDVLRTTKTLLTKRGLCLIRIPIASQGPWKLYGTDWAEIDAPRHFFLHTENSLNRLAHDAGFSIVQIDYEPEPFSYGASEMYRRDISLYSEEQGRFQSWEEVLSPEEQERVTALAHTNNVPGRAGRAAFYLVKTPSDQVTSSPPTLQ